MRQKSITLLIFMYITMNIAVINILSMEIMEGEIPVRQLRLVLAWMEIHQEELLANWTLCQNGEKPFAIEFLK
ncbi:MAG: DUF4160 domain-containing protein [Paludibacter sp.]|nr:DUF4160 domain-containing protein [Paludibacter sp.]